MQYIYEFIFNKISHIVLLFLYKEVLEMLGLGYKHVDQVNIISLEFT